MILGVVLGVYVGVWVFFIGGIVDIVEGVKATPVDSGLIAWGAAEVFILASFVGTVIAYAFGFVAFLCFNAGPRSHR